MNTTAVLYPAPGEKMGRRSARFDPCRAVSGLKRSIDSPLLLFAHHTGAIHWNVPKSLLSAKLCVNFWAFQPLRTDCPLNNLQFCQKWEHIGKIRVSGLWEQCYRDTLILWTLCGFLKAMNSSSSSKKKKDHVFIKDFVSSSGEAKSHLNDDCLSMH